MRANRLWMMMACGLLLAGCKEEKRAAAPDQAYQAAAQRAAEAELGRLAGGEVAVRGIQVWRQAAAETSAVCGQVNLRKGVPGGAYTLFVSVITPQQGNDPRGPLKAEQHVATSDTSASRVFVETLLRCYDGGGPATQRVGAPPLVPPVPDQLPAMASGGRPPPPAPPPLPAGQTANAPAPAGAGPLAVTATPGPGGAALGQVTMRQNGNLRAHPNGGGEVMRVIAQGSSLTIYEEAPGGWLRVGNGEPWGWIHASLTSR
ncbi:SH3 domain-containing protein [Roseomonas sp. 18066]|uniref:SH3 domain-containing protein n=1 Tax=Roseomonas sp. 18066 TaxID=2681412 RepID=UPI00135AE796|nr:SH3 domain-containing protein [Roseomonas sp. 18066]